MHYFIDHLISRRSFGLIVRFLELAAARMGLRGTLCALVLVSISCWCSASRIKANQTATLLVDASPGMGRMMPQNMFGIFFEVNRVRLSFFVSATASFSSVGLKENYFLLYCIRSSRIGYVTELIH